ncbi:MAG: hypothetical protein KR126chlam4_00640 [Candidatus Anoxychlamydiales bacterium]|uniref:Chorismate mutase domain-containing protein n=1 Tax=marine sediment metagenome TaxID=412755 RepID=A0A0F9IXH8_9ZZZZ|nr:hypothetical protein [Candidatus Anoxychlamydiales bacterium]HEU64161.1 chorismate mutase [Chlamydiota bacterium]
MTLKDTREQIDEIDEQIVPLLEKRLKLAKEIRKYKKEILDSNRENKILDKIKSEYIKDIYKTIFKNSKEVQRNLK